ncbi:hypothetical protein [Pseudoalteromonas ruthenica]|uniref:hypothetical protein n=1 Tax=Pseudoalteromonas ruthenica TaxID=151081 RepID=UPI00241FC9DA|nr:hypothetical protein [Pseudoalteromonas ruthenica]|tara:strand:- start:20237 stop:21160 length:924 start_codon:yes stop_codon:yes gene_type:complete
MAEKDITPSMEKALTEGKELLASKQSSLIQLGQIQAFNFVGKLVTVTELKIVQQIKESKSYKGLTYTDENQKVVTVTTWEECCKHFLHTDPQNIDNRLRNLQQFGEEFFEQAQQMKLGYRDLRALRQLPEDEQALVIESEAVEVGDKEAVKDLIDELKAKHKKELSKTKTDLDATEHMLRSSRELQKKSALEIQELKEQLEHKKFSSSRWQHEVKSLFEAQAKISNQILEGFNQLLVLNEQLDTMQLDEQTHHVATDAFYADAKSLLKGLAHLWNEIYRSHGHLDETAKPSGEWLAEFGYEGTEEVM